MAWVALRSCSLHGVGKLGCVLDLAVDYMDSLEGVVVGVKIFDFSLELGGVPA